MEGSTRRHISASIKGQRRPEGWHAILFMQPIELFPPRRFRPFWGPAAQDAVRGPYTLYLIPYNLYLIPYTLYLIPYTLYLISLYLIPYTLYLISLYLIPYTLYISESYRRGEGAFSHLHHVADHAPHGLPQHPERAAVLRRVLDVAPSAVDRAFQTLLLVQRLLWRRDRGHARGLLNERNGLQSEIKLGNLLKFHQYGDAT